MPSSNYVDSKMLDLHIFEPPNKMLSSKTLVIFSLYPFSQTSRTFQIFTIYFLFKICLCHREKMLFLTYIYAITEIYPSTLTANRQLSVLF
jgi:hypothetical protein